ncbi:MAG: TRAP transporter large permease [Pseudomonadota bacterium]
MSIELLTLLMFGGVLVLMLLGVPLGVSTGLIAAVFLIDPDNLRLLTLLTSRIYSFVNTYVLVSLPFFIFMASLMDRSGIAQDLFDAMRSWGGRRPGGLAVITTLAAVILASMTGVIGGEIMLLGLIALPQLLRLGYDEKLAIGVISAGGALGSMIPPSINLIIFALTANVSVGDLFVAAIVPGLLLAGAYAAYVLIRCHLDPSLGPPQTEADLPLGEKLRQLRAVILPLAVGGLVLGSIYLGVAAVTEAAALGALAMMLVTWWRGQLSLPVLWDVSLQTIRTSGIVLWLVFGAIALIGVYNFHGGTNFVKDAFLGADLSPVVLIGVMLLIWVVLGCFMEGTAICILTVPIFAPIVAALGYDLIWFGVMFAITCQIGYMTPPLGTAAFYMKTVAPPHVTLEMIYRSYVPFVAIQILVLLLVWAVPQLAYYRT